MSQPDTFNFNQSQSSVYVSDCTNVYQVPAGEIGPPYEQTTAKAACQSCLSPGAYWENNLQYTNGGPCSVAPDVNDGSGYISDGTNFYSGVGPSGYDTALDACSNPSTYFSEQIASTCAMEEFTLFGDGTSTYSKAVYAFFLLVVIGVLVLLYMRFKKHL
jgi:hypothetical protein